MHGFLSRYAVLTIIGAALLLAAWFKGWIDEYVLSDRTLITQGIAVVFVLGLVSAGLGDWQRVAWLKRRLVELGLLGTVVGFIIALGGVSPETVGDASAIQPMVAALIEGMGTALRTTLIGLIGYLWLALLTLLLTRNADD